MSVVVKSVSVAAIALLLGASQGSADPVKIRAAWIATPASLIPILFAKPGLAKHQGVSYQFDEIHFSASPTEITALATGDIEIGTLNFASFPIAVENAGLDDLKIIADETQDGTQDYATAEYKVLKDSPYQKVEDLKGKIVAVNGLGAGVDLGMRTFMLRHGLENKRDYTIIEVPFPNQKAVMLDHKADLVTGALPFIYEPDFIAASRTLFTLRDALNGTELSFWVVRKSVLEKNRAAYVDLLEDMVRAYRWYADPANHKEAVEQLARFTKTPAEKLDWAFTKRDTYRDPDGRPNLEMLKSNVNAVYKLDFIKADLDVAKYADLSLINEANQRLK